MIRPINDNIIVIPDKNPEKVGDIYLPETNKKPETGTVFKGCEDIKEGLSIVFKRYGATSVKMDKDEFLIVPREDILAIIED